MTQPERAALVASGRQKLDGQAALVVQVVPGYRTGVVAMYYRQRTEADNTFMPSPDSINARYVAIVCEQVLSNL
jgi:hypothetical protein